MKNFLKITILVLATTFVGCIKEQADTSKILSNEETRSEIMETIINDDKMISQFMDITNDSIKAGMMMEHMMGMMQKDSSIYRMMHRKMGNNPQMKGIMGKDSTMMRIMHK